MSYLNTTFCRDACANQSCPRNWAVEEPYYKQLEAPPVVRFARFAKTCPDYIPEPKRA